jgi:outer membrane protein
MMLAMNKCLLAVSAALAVASASAQSPARSDLLTIYREAEKTDATYASAQFARQAAGEAEPQARAVDLPTVNVGINASAGTIDSSYPDFNRGYGGWGPQITMTMPLYRPQNWDAIDQARLSVVAADATLAQARQDLILRVAQAYFDVLTAQDGLEAVLESKKSTVEQLAQAKREFEVGTKTIVDTHEAQARYDQTVALEQTARGQLIVARNALRTIIARDPGAIAALSAEPRLVPPQPSDVEAWASQAQQNSFQVAVATATAEIAQRETRRQRDFDKPTLDLSASASINRFYGSSTSPYTSTVRGGQVGINFNYPLYTGGATQSRIRQALANEDKARQDLESVRRTTAQAARQAFTGVDLGVTQVLALESAERSAKSQLESTQLGYQVGVRINLDVLNAQTLLITTQRDLKKARYDFLVNGLKLQSAAGSLTEQDIERINTLLR